MTGWTGCPTSLGPAGRARSPMIRSSRSLAWQIGMSQSAVSRIWRAFGLKRTALTRSRSARIRCSWTRSATSSACISSARESGRVVRGQEDRNPGPGPLGAGVAHAARRAERQNFDHIRHGTTSLFASLEFATGQVVSAVKRRHRHQEFLAFLSTIDKKVPADLDVHVVLDNPATHKTPAV